MNQNAVKDAEQAGDQSRPNLINANKPVNIERSIQSWISKQKWPASSSGSSHSSPPPTPNAPQPKKGHQSKKRKRHSSQSRPTRQRTPLVHVSRNIRSRSQKASAAVPNPEFEKTRRNLPPTTESVITGENEMSADLALPKRYTTNGRSSSVMLDVSANLSQDTSVGANSENGANHLPEHTTPPPHKRRKVTRKKKEVAEEPFSSSDPSPWRPVVHLVLDSL